MEVKHYFQNVEDKRSIEIGIAIINFSRIHSPDFVRHPHQLLTPLHLHKVPLIPVVPLILRLLVRLIEVLSIIER